MFDQNRADRAINFIQCLKHTKGQFHGQPFVLLPWQRQLVETAFGTVHDEKPSIRQYSTVYTEIPKKQGKQLALDTPLPTPTGWTTMGEVQIGDMVFDEHGKPCMVVNKSAVDDTEQAYRLTFRDGSIIVAGERHLWNVERIIGKRRPALMTTGEIYRSTEKHNARNADDPHERGRSIVRIRVSDPLRTVNAESLPVDPYLYGFWLGNGTATKPTITVRTCDLDDVLGHIPYKPHNSYPQAGNGSWVVYYDELKPVLVPNFRDKVIPPDYLRASEEQRWKLLQGLMDSDGSIGNRKAQSVYVSTVKQLAESVRELLWSLGIKNSMCDQPSTRYSEPTGETLYVIRFTTFSDQPTSQLDRKIARQRERVKDTRSLFHYLKSIEPLDERIPMQCIQVDSASHCYLAGRSMVPTHNSELGAAVALYLLCADNEWKAEVYGCASDRSQAGIIFDVAADMVRQSPALNSRIKIVDSMKRMVFKPTGSIYQVLSSDVPTKHGLNVSGCVFDELHTQPNRDLWDVMTQGSGDARQQPLWWVMTTAGTDRNSICWEVHQKAMDILEGRRIDPTFLPVVYGLSESEDWTLEENWYKANPSLGHTIDIDKVRQAFAKAKETPADENMFRQLRLNQWVKQSVRWMPMDKWDACERCFDESDLYGRPCFAGLDLSSTSDLTAFVLVFPPEDDGEPFYVLPYFFVPEESRKLRVRRDHVPYDNWVGKGYLTATEGNVVDYRYVHQTIVELREKFNIREIAYDRWNANMMVQTLEDDNFTMVPFGQGYKDMSPPTKELMRLVLEKQIAHSGHPVLRWNMDNVFVRTDPAGNVKMDKERSSERIDGAVAMVMGLDRAMRNRDTSSVYDGRGLLVL